MSTEVDICNLALGHLGDTATVSSLSPPEGSAQADHCARFYPIARDSLLEMHTWGFATRRETLALLNLSDGTEWDYVYAAPADAINLIAILPSDATDDYSQAINPTDAYNAVVGGLPLSAGGAYVPQAFSTEILENGTQVILTDQVNAVLRYSAVVTDTSQFSPLFTVALSWYLASMLAGPVIKGDAGAAEAKRCLGMMQAFLAKAQNSDAGQRRVDISHKVRWMSGR